MYISSVATGSEAPELKPLLTNVVNVPLPYYPLLETLFGQVAVLTRDS
jgi:hypothetical protein